MDRADVVVIGAGVMGSATARTLGERGVDTVLLEQFELGHARGSSHGPTRIFRIAYPEPDYVRMARRALRSWRALEEAAGEELLVTTGGLDTGPVAESVDEALTASGVDHERLAAPEAAERFPQVSFDGLDPIVFQPDAGVTRAGQTVAAQIRLAQASGVRVLERAPVLALDPDDVGVGVRTSDEEIRARVAVVTGGAWTGPLLARAGHAIPLQPILQTIAYFRGTTPGAEAIPTFIEWGSPDPDLVWYALGPAGTAPGVKLGAHVGGQPIDPADGPFAPDTKLKRTLGDYIRRRFPGLDPTPHNAETCLYTMTPDEDFVLDRIGPVVIGAGFSGHGFKFGPLIGEVLADLAMGRRSDPTTVPDRFSANRSGLRN
jgi:sarcosine oxidase